MLRISKYPPFDMFTSSVYHLYVDLEHYRLEKDITHITLETLIKELPDKSRVDVMTFDSSYIRSRGLKVAPGLAFSSTMTAFNRLARQHVWPWTNISVRWIALEFLRQPPTDLRRDQSMRQHARVYAFNQLDLVSLLRNE